MQKHENMKKGQEGLSQGGALAWLGRQGHNCLTNTDVYKYI